MKRLIICLVLSSGLLACQKEELAEENLSATGFEVVNQKTASVAITGAEAVQITLKNVVDSRCPTDAYCVWAGNAQTTIEIKTTTDSVQTASLCLGACNPNQAYNRRDSTTVLVNSKPYWLCLTAVNPYPSIASNNPPKTASLRLVPQ